MDLILFIIVAVAVVYVGYRMLNKESSDGSHPLDSVTPAPYKVEPPASTPVVTETTPIQPTIANTLDVNNDGKVNLDDVKEAVAKVSKKAKAKADVNKDGKVDKADAQAAAKKVKETVKKATTKKTKKS